LDSLSIVMRSPTGEILEKARIVLPECALRQMRQQLTARFGQAPAKVRLETRETLRFRYLRLTKASHNDCSRRST